MIFFPPESWFFTLGLIQQSFTSISITVAEALPWVWQSAAINSWSNYNYCTVNAASEFYIANLIATLDHLKSKHRPGSWKAIWKTSEVNCVWDSSIRTLRESRGTQSKPLEQAAVLNPARGGEIAGRQRCTMFPVGLSLLCFSWANFSPPPIKHFILCVQGCYYSNVVKLSCSLEKAFFLTKAAAAFQTTQTMQVSSLLLPSLN